MTDLIYETIKGTGQVTVDTEVFISSQEYKDFKIDIWITQTEQGFMLGADSVYSRKQCIYGYFGSLQEAQEIAKYEWEEFKKIIDNPPRCSICNCKYFPPIDTSCGCF